VTSQEHTEAKCRHNYVTVNNCSIGGATSDGWKPDMLLIIATVSQWDAVAVMWRNSDAGARDNQWVALNNGDSLELWVVVDRCLMYTVRWCTSTQLDSLFRSFSAFADVMVIGPSSRRYTVAGRSATSHQQVGPTRSRCLTHTGHVTRRRAAKCQTVLRRRHAGKSTCLRVVRVRGPDNVLSFVEYAEWMAGWMN